MEEGKVNIIFDFAEVEPEVLPDVTCPACGGQLVKKSFGYGCANYNTTKCSFSISSSICGKRMTDTIVKKLLSTGSTGKISGFKSKAGKSFSATIKLIDGKTEFEF